ncbi:MAG: leucine-rich repeat protein [Clostridia bacterium]|nr:leucine-rich repeat protein [Clostridia bacterium]
MKKTFKKALSLVLAIVLMFGCAPLINLADFCLVASAANYTDGDFTFAINDDSSATITKYSGRAEIVEVPESVSDGQFEHTVVKIGEKAFEDCQSYKVVIPDTVSQLSYRIFNKAQIAEVEIQGSISNVEIGWDGIGSSTNPGPFTGSNVTIVKMFGTNIPRYLFAYCSTLERIELPDFAKSSQDIVGEYAFANCINLEPVSIPNGIKTIGAMAFSGCCFTECTIPNTIEYIGDKVFANCSKLSSLVIPESTTNLGHEIFSGSSIESIEIKGRISSVDLGMFNGSNSGVFTGSNVKTVKMNSTHIPAYFFAHCSTLKNIELPSSVLNEKDYIGNSAFLNCINLEAFNIPEGITTVGVNGTITSGETTFYGCRKLKSIVIPSSVEKIAPKSFWGCSNLEYIHFNTTNCKYSDITDNLSTVICTSIVENPLGLTICDHNVNHDVPVIPPDEPIIPEEPEVVEKESSNGIKVNYDSTYFDNNDNIVLKAEEKDIENSNIAEYDEDGVLIKRYDIHLEDNNGNIVMSNESSTEYTVRIPVPTGYESYKQFLIRHWITLANGTKKGEVLNGKVENGYIVFKTTSFSDFDICNFGFEQKSMELIYTSTASLVATKDKDLTVTYTSSNPKVVTIDENGSITTHGRGNATITAMVETEKGETIKDTCEVTVKFTFWQWLIYIILFGFLWY